MLDFVSVNTTSVKRGVTDIYPEFLVKQHPRDLMIRGKSFYAVWDEERGLWSKSEGDVQRLVDDMVRKKGEELETTDRKNLKLMANFSSKKWTEWLTYCKSMPDCYHELDDHITFSNTPVKKTDYVTRRLDYPIEEGPIPNYEELISTLYDPEERQKLEWAIGAIISGDSKKIQKFIVLYGGPGTGKSTVLNIVEMLFPGYCSAFEAKALAQANNPFALEAFRDNPLISIQHDGDLSRIEDNTKLNSIVSHEQMLVNEKFKSTYLSQLKTFLFMGTNKPVKITDAKSGIIRRLIDVNPSGRTVTRRRYDELVGRIPYELGGIAYHCLEVYKSLGKTFYDGYVPVSMLAKTNDFYNFVEDNYDFFVIDHPEGISWNAAWLRYKEWVEEAKVNYPLNKRQFRDELRNYFDDLVERKDNVRNVFVGFKKEKIDYHAMKAVEKESKESEAEVEESEEEKAESWLKFKKKKSFFDLIFSDCKAQYATEEGIPIRRWAQCDSVLADLDTKKLHYVKVPRNLIVIDFDIKDKDGNKDLAANMAAANKWPQTYAELSKSGTGIHLHYFYDGDPTKLSRVYGPDIEVKVFTGNSSLRRMLTWCNELAIATISSGLPLKGEKPKVLQDYQIKSEKQLRDRIMRNLRKEIWANTKPSIDFIYQILEDAYHSDLKYDVRDMHPKIMSFAMNSTNQAQACMRIVSKMHFCSKDVEAQIDGDGIPYQSSIENLANDDAPIVFFDVEVFPNLFVVVYKMMGEGKPIISMINPTEADIQELIKFRLVGFNNRKYDNHILYARMMGYTELQLFKLSQRIINSDDKKSKDNALFNEAYNLSYTDIYDFLSSAHKMSLKKWEIKLKIHHQELGLPWDQPVPKEMWQTVADYCQNDVIATEAVWNANQEDWEAREMLAEISGLTVNDTTNQHTVRIIVGTDKHPQDQFQYTKLETIFPGYRYSKFGIPKEDYIPGTKIVSGRSIYRGEDPGEGGYVYANPGIWTNVALLDVASMHPHSLLKLNLFGDVYTRRFKDLVDARIYIKRGEFDKVGKMFDGKLKRYLGDPKQAKQLSTALKTAINSVYGLTSAKFPNKLRDPRNEDNIVAKYGALFMINLKHEVEDRGFTVVHIKTDSIKIAEATPEIISFCMNYANQYGYEFEHEATYSKMCLVNDAVYIAKYSDILKPEDPDEPKWTATGTQFQVPYVFKTLFSHEPIEFDDLCETKSVTTALYLDMNERLGEDEHDYHFVGRVGQFCPIEAGYGAGILLRDNNGKMAAATGTKKPGKVTKAHDPGVYRWMESEMVKELGLQDHIDMDYWNKLVDDAVDAISQYGDFEWFAA